MQNRTAGKEPGPLAKECTAFLRANQEQIRGSEMLSLLWQNTQRSLGSQSDSPSTQQNLSEDHGRKAPAALDQVQKIYQEFYDGFDGYNNVLKLSNDGEKNAFIDKNAKTIHFSKILRATLEEVYGSDNKETLDKRFAFLQRDVLEHAAAREWVLENCAKVSVQKTSETKEMFNALFPRSEYSSMTFERDLENLNTGCIIPDGDSQYKISIDLSRPNRKNQYMLEQLPMSRLEFKNRCPLREISSSLAYLETQGLNKDFLQEFAHVQALVRGVKGDQERRASRLIEAGSKETEESRASAEPTETEAALQRLHRADSDSAQLLSAVKTLTYEMFVENPQNRKNIQNAFTNLPLHQAYTEEIGTERELGLQLLNSCDYLDVAYEVMDRALHTLGTADSDSAQLLSAVETLNGELHKKGMECRKSIQKAFTNLPLHQAYTREIGEKSRFGLEFLENLARGEEADSETWHEQPNTRARWIQNHPSPSSPSQNSISGR